MFSSLYFKLGLLGTFVVALAACYGYGFSKGKSSVIKDVIAGTATFQKEQAVKGTEDVKQATADTQQLTKLTNERNELRKKLQQSAAQAPTNNDACVLAPNVLERVQQAARSTDSRPNKLP